MFAYFVTVLKLGFDSCAVLFFLCFFFALLVFVFLSCVVFLLIAFSIGARLERSVPICRCVCSIGVCRVNLRFPDGVFLLRIEAISPSILGELL